MRRFGTGAVRRRPALDVVRGVGLSLLGGLGACALALPEGRRPSLVLAGLGAAWLLAALITRWRVVGTVAVFFIACTPLMAGALDDEAATVPRLVVASLLLLVLVVGLDGVEHDDARLAPVAVRSGSPARRWSTPVVALAGSAVVAVAAGAPAVPSVPMVLLGLLAGVGAVVAATRLH